MTILSQYWSLVRLDSSGKIKTTEISQLKQFLETEFNYLLDQKDVSHAQIQNELLLVLGKSSNDIETIANKCLRCFISHQICYICIQLEMQFGREHNFSRSDLFIYTLNDTLENFRELNDKSNYKNSYKPLSVEILEKFEPKKASLSTWTTRLVKQNRELQRFLLEQGVYLISNWAILNDTNIKQLGRVLAEFHSLTPTEITTASNLLASYHAVYRRDRLKNKQGKGGRCQTPSEEQLAQISELFEQATGISLSVEQILSSLEQVATQLREYRIYVRGGQRKQEKSFDNAELNTEGLQASVITEEYDRADSGDFLAAYQQQFQKSLDRSVDTVIQTKLSKFKGKKAAKAPQYLQALELFHCEGKAMGEIAKVIGMEAQYQVTRLLKLKELRADIRQQMLQIMGDWTTNQTAKFTDRDTLKSRENAIAEALGEQIDLVLEEAEKEVSIVGQNRSVLAEKICTYLDTVSV